MTVPSSEHSGVGATSLGTMVPILEAPNREVAERLAHVLGESAIPALVQSAGSDFIGLMIPTDGAWVVVPASMRAEAELVLRRLAFVPRERLLVTSSEETVELDEEGPIEVALPEPSPLAPRVMIAGLAIVVAAVTQRILESALGREAVMRGLGATTRHVEQWWRVITAGFLHSSFSHHFYNALFGLVMGVVLFGTHGFGATMLTWLLSSATGMLAELAASTDPTLVVGASAGNYGLIGLWAKGQLDRSRVSALPRRERLKTLGVLLVLVPGALTPVSAFGSRTAVFAHVAGFVAGFALGYVFLRRAEAAKLERVARRSHRALIAAVSLTLCAFLSAALYLISTS